MKRLTLLATAALCGVAYPVMAQEPITLKFWDNQQTESGLSRYQQEAVRRFEAENPNIKVEVTTLPYPEYQQRLLTAVQGGNAPDVSTLDQVWIAAFARAGALMPLDREAKAADVTADAFFRGAWETVTYGGKLWGIPFNVDVWFFSFVNKAMFKEAGIDPASITTFTGLKNGVEKLTDAARGKYGIGLFGHKGEDTVVIMDSFIFSNGGKVLDENGKCALTSPQAVEALTYLQSLIPYAPRGILNASSGDMRELFLNGSLAIEFWPTLEQPTLQKSKIDWDFAVGHALEGKIPIGTYGGWNLAVYQSSQHKEAAWKFVQFLTREDVNGAVVDLIPANVKAAKVFLNANRKGADRIVKHLENAASRPLSARYLELSDIQVAMAQEVYSGGDPKAAAHKACAAIDALN